MTARPVRLDHRKNTASGLPDTVAGQHDLDQMCAIVEALPNPAMIAEVRDGCVTEVKRNRPFKEFVRERLADTDFNMAAETHFWTQTIMAVASGEEENVQRDLTFAGDLGTRAFRISIARIGGPSSRPSLVLLSATDHSDGRRIEKVLRRELLTDALTALPNRAGFLEEVEARNAGREQGHAIIVVDIIRFSRINESLGAIAGDELIITVARRIKSILRSGDLLGRVGGNEFAIHSASVYDLEDARQIAKRVQAALETPIRISSYLINVEAAVGCAIRQQAGEESEELFRRAQAAVKQSKRTGTFEVYRPSSLTEAQERFTLENRLRESLQQGALELAFQPFVSLVSGEVVGFEALARWTDAELGRVPPSQFIPVAEDSGLIVPLGRWALRESASRLAQWDKAYGCRVPLTINVNLSPVQIVRDDVSEAVREALDNAGIAGDRLTIELTESALIADLDKTRSLLDALKAMDLTIAMDDFGTGFSNLANLQSLPIDVLKIDGSFVTGMVGDRDKVAIVHAILSLARALGMRTVAEGVETAEVGQALGELGCDRGQGYYYARPMSADAAYAFWLERNQSATS